MRTRDPLPPDPLPVSPGFEPRPSLSGGDFAVDLGRAFRVSPGFEPRPSLSVPRRGGQPRSDPVSPGFEPRPSLSGIDEGQPRAPIRCRRGSLGDGAGPGGSWRTLLSVAVGERGRLERVECHRLRLIHLVERGGDRYTPADALNTESSQVPPAASRIRGESSAPTLGILERSLSAVLASRHSGES